MPTANAAIDAARAASSQPRSRRILLRSSSEAAHASERTARARRIGRPPRSRAGSRAIGCRGSSRCRPGSRRRGCRSPAEERLRFQLLQRGAKRRRADRCRPTRLGLLLGDEAAFGEERAFDRAERSREGARGRRRGPASAPARTAASPSAEARRRPPPGRRASGWRCGRRSRLRRWRACQHRAARACPRPLHQVGAERNEHDENGAEGDRMLGRGVDAKTGPAVREPRELRHLQDGITRRGD